MQLMPLSCLLFLQMLSPQADTPNDATTELENAWVRIVRVHYRPHEKTATHDHPAFPTVYIYVTDGGRLRIGHDGEAPVVRPAVKAGGIRFQAGVNERHAVEELDGIESEYLRIELKTNPIDLPEVDVRRAPDDTRPYESGMLRILRITCAAESECPASSHPKDPAVLVTGRSAVWVEPDTAPVKNLSAMALKQIRIELKTPPPNSAP